MEKRAEKTLAERELSLFERNIKRHIDKLEVPEDLWIKVGLAGCLFAFLIIAAGTVVAVIHGSKWIDGILLAVSLATGVELALLTESSLSLKLVYIFLALGGEVITFYIFWLVIDYFLSGRIREAILGVKDMAKIKALRNHFIICGSGRVGRALGEHLAKEHEKVVYIERDETEIIKMHKEKKLVVNADALDEKSLTEAGINHARGLAAVLGDEGDNLLLVITARELNKGLYIVARANHEGLVKKFRHAGANDIVMPEHMGGVAIAEKLLQKK